MERYLCQSSMSTAVTSSALRSGKTLWVDESVLLVAAVVLGVIGVRRKKPPLAY